MAKKAESGKETLNLFRELEKAGLRYLVVGGLAAVLYGVKRATFDVDIAVAPSEKDLGQLLGILKKLHYRKVIDIETGKDIAGICEVTPEMVLARESVRVLNDGPIDVMVVPLDKFDFLWSYRVETGYQGVKIQIPSLLDLIRIKEQAGRPIDIQDAAALRHLLRTRKRD